MNCRALNSRSRVRRSDHVPPDKRSRLRIITSHPSSLRCGLNILQSISTLVSRAMSYIPVPKGSHFSIKNIPFGIFSTSSDSTPRPATAIGEFVLDLSVLAKEGAFSKVPGLDASTLQQVIVHTPLIDHRQR
jgi:hypothetical protein